MSDSTDLLRDAFINARPTSDGWHRATCPFCEFDGHTDTKASLALRLDNGWYQCWRCGEKGFAKSLVEDAEGQYSFSRTDLPPPVAPVERATIPLPDGFIALGVEPGLSALVCARARNYLTQRGVHETVWREAGIGAVVSGYYGRRIIVPVTTGQECYGWVARSWGSADRKYLYPKGMKRSLIMFNQDALYVDTNNPIFVVEGVFDALNLWPDAVAVLGKPAKQHLQLLLATCRPIAVVLDADARSDSIALTMQLQLYSKNVCFIELPGGTDPADLPSDWIRGKAIGELNGESRIC